jgi:hypothetical protein
MRTTPLHADWVDLGPDRIRVVNDGLSILRPPGTYTVTLEVDGQMYTQPLNVLKDPNSEGSEEDIAAQVAVLERIRSDHDLAADAINRIELVRRQLDDLSNVLEERSDAVEVLEACEVLVRRLIEVEEPLIQLRLTGTGQDGVRWPAKISERLRYLAQNVGTADFPPNVQQGEVHAVLKEQLEAARAAVDSVLSTDLPAFNRMLERRSLPGVITDGS